MAAQSSPPPVAQVPVVSAAPVIPTSPPLQGTVYTPDVTLWINVGLATASLSVTCVGVVVAIVAIFGYRSAKRMLRREAEKHARQATREHLESDLFKSDLLVVARLALSDNIKDKMLAALSDAIPTIPRTEMNE